MSPPPVHLFLTSELFYPELPGGLMRFFRYGPGLVERGIKPVMVTLRHQESWLEMETVNRIEIHRIDGHAMANPQQQRIRLLDKALELATEARRQGAHAVLQPNIVTHRMIPVFLRARMRGIPVVYNIGIAPESVPPFRWVARRKRWWSYRFLYAMLSRTVLLSDALHCAYASEYGLVGRTVSVIPNGVDLQRFRPCLNEKERVRLREDLGFSPDQKVVLFVGGVMPRKGVDILLRAWDPVSAVHPDACLAVLGSHGMRASHEPSNLSGELAEYLRQIRQISARLSRPESVRFLGEMEDPAPVYRIADVFAFPSLREGLPNAVLEAMSTALPCLIASFEGMPRDGETFGHEGTHYTGMDHAPESWTTKLTEWLKPETQPALRQMGAAAREWIASTNKLSIVLDHWARLYRSACRLPDSPIS